LHDKRGHVAGVVTNCEHPWAGFCTIFDVGDISSALQQAIMSAVGVGNPPANAPYLMSSLGRWTTSISASPQENCINGYRPFGFTRSKIKGRPRRGEADIVDTKGQVEEALYRNAVERGGHFAAFGQPARSCRS
jgi:hypothetical protein